MLNRLTPVYAFVILVWTSVLPYMIDSPIMILDPFKAEQQKCYDYWLTNLLYIDNFYPQNFRAMVSLLISLIPIAFSESLTINFILNN